METRDDAHAAEAEAEARDPNGKHDAHEANGDRDAPGARTAPAPAGVKGGLLRRTISEIREDGLTDWAAALTYYTVLAIFPALIALVSIVGLVADPKETTKSLTDLVSKIGPGAADTLKQPIDQLTSNRSAAGIALIIGLVGALWTASGYVGAFSRASNRIYEVQEGRPVWKMRPLQMLVTLVMVLLVALVAAALVVTGPLASDVGSAIGAGDAAVTAWDIAKWPVILLIVVMIISVLYYSSPNAKPSGFRSVLPGALLAVVVWLVASAAFAFFVANFGSYNKTYGSLAAVIVFLVWLWITNLAVLIGAELNAERERSRQLDAGVAGADRSLGLEPRGEVSEKQRAKTV